MKTIIITYDDVAFGNNSVPEAPSPVSSGRASSDNSSNRCCGAAEGDAMQRNYQGVTMARECGAGSKSPDCP